MVPSDDPPSQWLLLLKAPQRGTVGKWLTRATLDTSHKIILTDQRAQDLMSDSGTERTSGLGGKADIGPRHYEVR